MLLFVIPAKTASLSWVFLNSVSKLLEAEIPEVYEKIVGMIEIRNDNHISLFFVEEEFQGKGIGKAIFRKALKVCLSKKLDMSEMSVNSAPSSLPIYQRFGFEQTGPEQVHKGMRYIPMVLKIASGKR